MAKKKPEYNNNTSILAGGSNRRKSNSAFMLFNEGQLVSDDEKEELLDELKSQETQDDNKLEEGEEIKPIESKILYQEIDVNDISVRPINAYDQDRIEELAESIKATDNRLIHPIILVEPKDLKKSSKVLQKYNELGVDISTIKYVIVAGERRYHAWCLLRDKQQLISEQFGTENIYNTITANILTPEQAVHEERYYEDSNDQSRITSEITQLKLVKLALGKIQTDEDKRNALIKMNDGSETGIPDDPTEAAKKYNAANYVTYYVNKNLKLDLKVGTIKNYNSIIKNCDEVIYLAIIDGDYPIRNAKEITSLDFDQQKELLDLWKSGNKDEYKTKLASMKNPEKKPGEKFKTGKDITRQVDSLKNRNEKSLVILDALLNSLDKTSDKNKVKKIKLALIKFNERLNEIEAE